MVCKSICTIADDIKTIIEKSNYQVKTTIVPMEKALNYKYGNDI